MQVGRGIAGSPRTVADFLSEQMSRARANYCLMYLALGDMTIEEIETSVRLFADEVMPRLQGQPSNAHQQVSGAVR